MLRRLELLMKLHLRATGCHSSAIWDHTEHKSKPEHTRGGCKFIPAKIRLDAWPAEGIVTKVTSDQLATLSTPATLFVDAVIAYSYLTTCVVLIAFLKQTDSIRSSKAINCHKH